MAFLAKGDILVGDFLLTKHAADLSPHYAMLATDPRRELAKRIEAAMSADALSVALDQPHRLGDPSKGAGDALSNFCKRLRLRPECRRAGEQYGHQVRDDKSARGFHVIGQAPGEGDILTEAERAARDEAAILALAKSNGMLTLIHPRCPRRLELLCYDGLEPATYDEGILTNALLNLAMDFGLIDLGINRDKPT